MKRQVPRLEGLAKRLGKGEFIGLPARVAKANDAGIVGLEGVVVDETLKTLTLDVAGRAIQLAKAGTIWSFQMPKGDWVEIDGRAIGFRPEDRGKKVK